MDSKQRDPSVLSCSRQGEYGGNFELVGLFRLTSIGGPNRPRTHRLPGKTSVQALFDPQHPPAPRGCPRSRYRRTRSRWWRPFRTVSIWPRRRPWLRYRSRVSASRRRFNRRDRPRAPAATSADRVSAHASWQGYSDPAASQSQPPSPDMAVGPSDVVMVVNSSIAQFTKSGTLEKASTFQRFCFGAAYGLSHRGRCLLFRPAHALRSAARPFSVPGDVPIPMISSTRICCFRSPKAPPSTAGGPSGRMDAALDGTIVTGFWGDFWRLGFDDAGVYLSGNMYNSVSEFPVRQDPRGDEIRTVQYGDHHPALEGHSILKMQKAPPADSHHAGAFAGQAGGGQCAVAGQFHHLSACRPHSLTVWKIIDPDGRYAGDHPVHGEGTVGLRFAGAGAAGLQRHPSWTPATRRILKAVYRNGFMYTARNTGYAGPGRPRSPMTWWTLPP